MKRAWAVVLPLLLSRLGLAQEGAAPLETADDGTLIIEPREVSPPEPPVEDSRTASESPSSGSVSPRSQWAFLWRIEATALTLLPRMGAGENEAFVQLEPTLVVDGGERWGVNLGAPLRLRLWGSAGAGKARKEDWDTLSDWGQVVRFLKLGTDGDPFALRAGSLDCYSLLSGHLVRRYSNRMNPDYHPAGALLTGTLGPLYAEAFTSDVLGARLMGAEAALDMSHVLFGQPRQRGRHTLSLSVVHDWARAGGTSRQVTLAHLDGTTVVLVRRGETHDFELHLVAGWGGRPGVGGAWGVVAGVGVDAVSPSVDVLARLEVRRQRGGFRQGYFGPDYELTRFRVAGTASPSLADAPFPEGYSVLGEWVMGWDAARVDDPVQRRLRFSVGAEVFSWGRVDADGRLAVRLFRRDVEATLRTMAVGMRQPGTRYVASGEVRWRFLGGGFYALGEGGTLLYPQADGALRPVAFAAIGMGADHAR